MKRSYFFAVLSIVLMPLFCGAAVTPMSATSEVKQVPVPASTTVKATDVPTTDKAVTVATTAAKPTEKLVAPDESLVSDGTQILLKSIPFDTYFKVIDIGSKKYGITATAKKAEASVFIVGLDGTDFTFKSPDAKTAKDEFLFMQLADRNVIQFVNVKPTVREKWALRVTKSDTLKDARIQSKLNGAFVMACDPEKPTVGHKLGEVCGTVDGDVVSGAAGLCKIAVNYVTTMPDDTFYGGDSATSVAIGSRLGSFLLLAIGLDGKLRKYDPEDIKPWGVMPAKDEMGTDIVGLDSVEATSYGAVYLNDKSGKVYCYDWDAKVFKLLPPGSDPVHIDQLSVGRKGEEDFVLGVDLNTKTLYQYDFKKPGWVARTEADECMYVGVRANSSDKDSTDGMVIVIDPNNQVFRLKSIRADGSFAWKQMPDIVLSNVALGDKNVAYGTYKGKSYQMVGDKWVEEKDKTGKAVYGIRDQRFNAMGSRVMLDLDLYIERVGETAVPYVAPKPVTVETAKVAAAPVAKTTVKVTAPVAKKTVKASTIAKLGVKPDVDDPKIAKARAKALAGVASKAQKAQPVKAAAKVAPVKTKAVKKQATKPAVKKGADKKKVTSKAVKATEKKAVAKPASKKSAPVKGTAQKSVEA